MLSYPQLKVTLRGLHLPGGIRRGGVHQDPSPEGGSVGSKRWRVALAEGPPFVMTSQMLNDDTCHIGVACLQVRGTRLGKVMYVVCLQVKRLS